MNTYFRVEFETGKEGIGPFVHVAARTPDRAAVLAKAERIAQRNSDLRIEHVWEIMGALEVEQAKPFLQQAIECVIPDSVFKNPPIKRDKNGQPIGDDDYAYLPQVLEAMRQPPMEMMLCEARRVSLQPNLAYVFIVDRNCEKCLQAEKIAKGEA